MSRAASSAPYLFASSKDENISFFYSIDKNVSKFSFIYLLIHLFTMQRKNSKKTIQCINNHWRCQIRKKYKQKQKIKSTFLSMSFFHCLQDQKGIVSQKSNWNTQLLQTWLVLNDIISIRTNEKTSMASFSKINISFWSLDCLTVLPYIYVLVTGRCSGVQHTPLRIYTWRRPENRLHVYIRFRQRRTPRYCVRTKTYIYVKNFSGKKHKNLFFGNARNLEKIFLCTRLKRQKQSTC